MTNNYWGSVNTAELQRAKASSGKNAAFIYDGYDDENKATVDWNGFVTQAWEFAGFKGENFIDFVPSLVQEVSTINEVKIGNNIQFALSLKSGGIISKYRIAQSMEDLFNEEWTNYSGNCRQFTAPSPAGRSANSRNHESIVHIIQSGLRRGRDCSARASWTEGVYPLG